MSPQEECIRVALVAPQMTCWGLQQLVQSSPPMTLVGTAPTLEAVMQGASPAAADVVVVDFDDPAALSTLTDFLTVCASRVVVLTAANDMSSFDAAVLKGLQGIVRKNDPPQVLLKAIEKVHLGELWIDRGS